VKQQKKKVAVSSSKNEIFEQEKGKKERAQEEKRKVFLVTKRYQATFAQGGPTTFQVKKREKNRGGEDGLLKGIGNGKKTEAHEAKTITVNNVPPKSEEARRL